MNLKHEEKGRKGSFYFEKDSERLAKLEYVTSTAAEMTIYHTEVDEKLRGEGVGEALVEAAVKHARESRLKVIPTCSFAKAVIDRTPKFQDVLA